MPKHDPATGLQLLEKTPNEADNYTMDVSGMLATGDTIDSVTSVTATPAGLTIGSPASTTTTIQAKFSSGTVDIRYTVKFLFVDTAGNIKEACGLMDLKDCVP